jgi:RNA polymerase sigma-70 factor (ECF subfamily)
VPVEPPDLPDPRDATAAADVAMDVEAALAALPVEQRTALVLVDLQGFSVDQAAAVLECPPGTVKSRCFRGRAHLARLLPQYGPGNQDDAQRVPSHDNQDGA